LSHPNPVEEAVADKGYHSNETMTDFVELEIRSYVSEPVRRSNPRRAGAWRRFPGWRMKERWKGEGSVRSGLADG
jgi:hypothetical protein